MNWPSTVLLVITDGRRGYLERTIHSALASLDCDFDEMVIYDDTGEEAERTWLRQQFSDYGFEVIGPPFRQGFGGAIRWAWQIIDTLDVEYVLHLEADFTFNRPVTVAQLATVLDTNAELAQVCLRRQPWNAEEKAAGGIVEQHPDDYTDRSDVFGNHWLEHRRFFSTNPCLYRRSLCERGWPDVEHSEGVFTHQLLADGYRFAFWGERTDTPWVTHIGTERAGVGY